ncbi:hypothetical protein [Amycolatopsis viridis]|uniref:Uncharacterized protein n=1 Tax=Amycolatopsis viridis TaxID=185678 RepID=A0ABX0T2S7_9PSEU|nr:hypothetical protein [Amycolatopsis viridis]NIH82214.1 hypothetical protein [Amycolatopsis viridis]
MAERTLTEQLGAEPPPGVAALDPAHQRDLADALRSARRRQAAALAKAGNDALKFVPALLRPAVRKAVGL